MRSSFIVPLAVSLIGCSAPEEAPIGASSQSGALSKAEMTPPQAEECSAPGADAERESLMIKARYYDQGHVDVQLEPPVKRGDRTCFKVHPGKRYRLASIRVVDEDQRPGESLGDPAALAGMLRLHPGDWFSRGVIVQDIQAIRTRYQEAGYADVQVDVDSSFNNQTAQAEIEIPIRRGRAK